MKNKETEEMKAVLMDCLLTVLLMAVSAVFCMCIIIYEEQIASFFTGILNE